MLQFSFPNFGLMPASLKTREQKPEDPSGMKLRKSNYAWGTPPVIPPTYNCSVEGLIAGLRETGYELVGASWQERLDARNQRGDKKYYALRISFFRPEYVITRDEAFEKIRENITDDLAKLSKVTTWRIRAYLNSNGRDEKRWLSINLEKFDRDLFNNQTPDGHVLGIKDGAVTLL